jgi:hypothetical protein
LQNATFRSDERLSGARAGDSPSRALRDAMLAHMTMAEGLTALFASSMD